MGLHHLALSIPDRIRYSKVQQGLQHVRRAMRHGFHIEVSLETSPLQIYVWFIFIRNWPHRLDSDDIRISIGPHSVKLPTSHLHQLMLGLDLHHDHSGIRRHLPSDHTWTTHSIWLRNLRHGHCFSTPSYFHKFSTDGLPAIRCIYRDQTSKNSRPDQRKCWEAPGND